MPKQELQNNFDTTEDEKELEAAQAELLQSQQAIDKGFAKYMSESGLTPELEELFFSDKVAFFEAVEAEKERFIEEQLSPKVARVGELRDNISRKQVEGEHFKAKQNFLKANPEADFAQMADFYQNNLTKKQQEEIDSLPLEEQLARVLELMGGKKEKSSLPKHYEGGEMGDLGGENDIDLPALRN